MRGGLYIALIFALTALATASPVAPQQIVVPLSLSVAISPNTANTPARELSVRGLENLTAFARLYGYVRYFHPSDEASEVDWSDFLRAGVEQVEGARSAEELRETLRALFAPLAPSVRIGLRSETPLQMDVPVGETIAWFHLGLGGGQWSGRETIYSSQRAQAATDIPYFARLDLPRNLVAFIPLRLARNASGHTLPVATAPSVAPRPTPAEWRPTGDDRTSRLAAVIEAWNVPQHFYPQMETQGVDWPTQLTETLVQAARDPDANSFDRTMRRMALALRDGHAGINRVQSPGVMPFACDWIEGHVVVTAVDGEVADLRPGDVVQAIDQRPMSELIAQSLPAYGGATPAHLRANVLFEIMRGGVGQPADVVIERNGRRNTIRVFRAAHLVPESRPAPVSELERGFFYVDLTRVTDDLWAANLASLSQARAIVFDMRGYPTAVARRALPHLSDRNIISDQFNRPLYTQPDQQNVFYRRGSWHMAPETPRFAGVFVFMTNESATSAGESIMSVVENASLGPIVGAPTSGTNGNINRIVLLTGHALTWTGLQVRRPDGSRRFGVGVQPTVSVQRTIAGVRAGRDEVLEAAIATARASAFAPR